MADSLSALLKRSEREPAILHADQVIAWPAGDLEHWIAAGVLRPLSPTSSLPCLGCGGEHVGEVVFLTEAGTGATRAYLPCPSCGPSAVSPAALRRWQIEMERFLTVIFAGFLAIAKPTVLEPDRLWRVGRTAGGGGHFSVYFGRHLHRRDVPEILARNRIPAQAVVFAAWHLPERPLESPGPLLLPLGAVVSLAVRQVHFDRAQVEERLAEWRHSRVRSPRRPLSKRASRAADIAALSKEMQEHLRAARDHAIATRDHAGHAQLLPRPTQGDLAHRVGVSQWTVSRCLGDPEARELQFLWELAADVERIVAYGR